MLYLLFQYLQQLLHFLKIYVYIIMIKIMQFIIFIQELAVYSDAAETRNFSSHSRLVSKLRDEN